MTYVRNLFRDLYRRHGFENPQQWDWDAARAPPRPLSTETDDRPGTAGAVARPGTADTLSTRPAPTPQSQRRAARAARRAFFGGELFSCDRPSPGGCTRRPRSTPTQQTPPRRPSASGAPDHAALIADVGWKNVYASRKRAVGRQSPSLRGPAWPWILRRGTSKRAKRHEQVLVHELRDYETSGGDLDAIRQHIGDAASARVWDMFLTDYKCFSRTG